MLENLYLSPTPTTNNQIMDRHLSCSLFHQQIQQDFMSGPWYRKKSFHCVYNTICTDLSKPPVTYWWKSLSPKSQKDSDLHLHRLFQVKSCKIIATCVAENPADVQSLGRLCDGQTDGVYHCEILGDFEYADLECVPWTSKGDVWWWYVMIVQSNLVLKRALIFFPSFFLGVQFSNFMKKTPKQGGFQHNCLFLNSPRWLFTGCLKPSTVNGGTNGAQALHLSRLEGAESSFRVVFTGSFESELTGHQHLLQRLEEWNTM